MVDDGRPNGDSSWWVGVATIEVKLRGEPDRDSLREDESGAAGSAPAMSAYGRALPAAPHGLVDGWTWTRSAWDPAARKGGRQVRGMGLVACAGKWAGFGQGPCDSGRPETYRDWTWGVSGAGRAPR